MQIRKASNPDSNWLLFIIRIATVRGGHVWEFYQNRFKANGVDF
jgi:hypothetical protein